MRVGTSTGLASIRPRCSRNRAHHRFHCSASRINRIGDDMRKDSEELKESNAPSAPPRKHTGWSLSLEIWNTTLAVAQLRSRTVTQREQCEALIIILAILYVGVSMRVFLWPESFSLVSLARFFVDPLGLCSAVIVSYGVNRNNDNADFAIRFTCLLIPVLVRIVVVFSLVLFIWLLFGLTMYGEAFDEMTRRTTWLDVIFVAVMYACIVWRLAVHMSLVSRLDHSSGPA